MFQADFPYFPVMQECLHEHLTHRKDNVCYKVSLQRQVSLACSTPLRKRLFRMNFNTSSVLLAASVAPLFI
jgi:hypothetical protein